MDKFEKLARWFTYQIKLQDRFDSKIPSTTVHRGDIYACYLGENLGHEKSRLEGRPCVVVSSDKINSRSSNIIVAPLSKNIKYQKGSTSLLKYEWNYVLKRSKYKLYFDSMVQCEDLKCISKIRLGTYIDHVDTSDMQNIKKRLKSTLQI